MACLRRSFLVQVCTGLPPLITPSGTTDSLPTHISGSANSIAPWPHDLGVPWVSERCCILLNEDLRVRVFQFVVYSQSSPSQPERRFGTQLRGALARCLLLMHCDPLVTVQLRQTGHRNMISLRTSALLSLAISLLCHASGFAQQVHVTEQDRAAIAKMSFGQLALSILSVRTDMKQYSKDDLATTSGQYELFYEETMGSC